jgi:hypothetical protein
MNSLFRLFFGSRNSEGVEMVNTPETSSSSSSYRPEEKLTFEETVSHLARGYENSQRVIQFMDAKAGAVIALCLAIFALVGKMVGWAFGAGAVTAFQALSCWEKCSLAVAAFAIILCGFGTLSFAFKTVKPNPLPGWDAFAALFPAHAKRHVLMAKERLNPFLLGADQGDVVREYEAQLIAVGQLVHGKIAWLRLSVWFLWGQGLASGILGAVIMWATMADQLK